ncbi:MAG TPA: glycosyltransferase [Aggregatilineales bacterium]|nr:glycosyltransferase [Aggregatilineales bacterium]
MSASNDSHTLLTNTLSDNERDTLLNLWMEGTITETQLEEAVQRHRAYRSSLRDILGSMGVNQESYASWLAESAETGFVSELIGSEYFDYDPEFIRRFDPPTLIRFLFCPLRQLDEQTVIALAAETDEDAETYITQAVQQVIPGAEVVILVGTEIDITRMVNSVFEKPLIHKAINLIREQNPAQSASTVFTYWQKVVFWGLGLLLVLALILDTITTLQVIVVLFSLVYVIGVFYKLVISLASFVNDGHGVTKEHIAELSDAELPIYSILVPVYKEPEVVPRLLKALARMDYPKEKLDVLVLMEADDAETIESAKAARPPSFFRFIIVPDSLPRTKPKACNYGLNFCRGKYVTIYDAEDVPEPDQLKKAVAAFEHGGEKLICVQAALNYFNAKENYLTRMFTLEYSYWFDTLLPGLDRLGLPIPLGGTSNHFRLDALWKLLAWDPFNVTEDADLGIRASSQGYTVGIIRSTTYEEANKAFKNWIRQRSRWIKGYMQTWLVHNRNPLKLLRVIGLKQWLSYNFFIGGTFAIFLINPLMWFFFIIWLVFQPAWMGLLFYGWVWQLAFFSLIVGNLLAIFLNMLAVVRRRKYDLLPYALTNPIYWTMHSIASYMGLWQLITKPFYWEKTNHGLTHVNTDHLFEEAPVSPTTLS